MGTAGFPAAGRGGADRLFHAALIGLGGVYLALIVAMLAADFFFAPPREYLRLAREAIGSPEIRYAVWLSLFSCTVTALLSVLVAVPAGYLLSRAAFPGKGLVDAVLDIPIVLPPLVVGLSLLVLARHPDAAAAYGLLPAAVGAAVWALARRAGPAAVVAALASAALAVAVLHLTGAGGALRRLLLGLLGPPAGAVPFTLASVIIAQFAVAGAFAIRTMRVTFDQISPRSEAVALTLGCTRAQAFFRVVLPEARRGVLAAGTLAWARALGEFGPILVFSGATPLRTEVLPTAIFLELSIGRIEAAMVVSLLLVVAALAVLLVIRLLGLRETGLA